jgi:hypothetical protein
MRTAEYLSVEHRAHNLVQTARQGDQHRSGSQVAVRASRFIPLGLVDLEERLEFDGAQWVVGPQDVEDDMSAYRWE